MTALELILRVALVVTVAAPALAALLVGLTLLGRGRHPPEDFVRGLIGGGLSLSLVGSLVLLALSLAVVGRGFSGRWERWTSARGSPSAPTRCRRIFSSTRSL